MPSATSIVCTHPVGQGITVCLRCRQEQRQRSRARQLRVLTRVGASLVAVVAVVGLGARVTNGWRFERLVVGPVEPSRAIAVADVKLQGASAPVSRTSLVAGPASAPAPAPVTAPAPLVLSVPEGRTTLADSILADRRGDSVTVSFDTRGTRTRRRDKFARVVRQTLPALYGAPADSLLAATPDSALFAGGDLLSELPSRGVHLPLADGWTLVLHPQTRPGQDGPLVVRYRVYVAKL